MTSSGTGFSFTLLKILMHVEVKEVVPVSGHRNLKKKKTFKERIYKRRRLTEVKKKDVSV